MFAISAISNRNICLRECARIIQLAKDNNCKITLICHGKVGTSDSMLSLASLAISKDNGLVLKLEGLNSVDESKVYRELKEIFK